MNNRLAVFLLLSGLSSLHAQSVCANGSHNCVATDSANTRNVYEILTPAIGDNVRVYTLHAVPSPHAQVHLFRARTELNPGTDYTIEGRFITVAGSEAGTGNDELRAQYSVDAMPDASGAEPLASQSSRNETRELLTKYLDRALDLSSSPSIANQKGFSTDGVETDLQRRAHPARRAYAENPASLRMLSEAVLRAPAIPEQREIRGGRKARIRLDTAASDGIGDQTISSPFDLLANSPEGLDESLKSLHGTASKRTLTIKPLRDFVPRSLVMLQNRVVNHQ